MEVAMTRTTIRHTLSALAAVALVSAFASSPALAQSSDNPRKYGVFMDTKHGKAKTPKGLATERHAKPNTNSGEDVNFVNIEKVWSGQ
jgi:hypothetical protein